MFQHSIYSKIVSWYLLLNGTGALLIGFYYVSQQGYVENKVTYAICSIAFPMIAALLGYFLILRSKAALNFLRYYFILSIPILGFSSFLYSHAHGMGISFSINVGNLHLGINAIAIIALALLRLHYDKTHITQTIQHQENP